MVFYKSEICQEAISMMHYSSCLHKNDAVISREKRPPACLCGELTLSFFVLESGIVSTPAVGASASGLANHRESWA